MQKIFTTMEDSVVMVRDGLTVFSSIRDVWRYVTAIRVENMIKEMILKEFCIQYIITYRSNILKCD